MIEWLEWFEWFEWFECTGCPDQREHMDLLTRPAMLRLSQREINRGLSEIHRLRHPGMITARFFAIALTV